MLSRDCPVCHGKRLRRESLSVTFAGLDIAEISRLPLARLADILRPYADGTAAGLAKLAAEHPEKAIVVRRIAQDLVARLAVLLDLGLGYLVAGARARRRSRRASCSGCGWPRRSAPTCSASSTCSTSRRPGCIPADTEALLRALDRLKASGNSLFVVEHDLDVIRHADWIVDVGPGRRRAGRPRPLQRPARRARATSRRRRRGATSSRRPAAPRGRHATPEGWLRLAGVTRNNLHGLDVAFPLGRVHDA